MKNIFVLLSMILCVSGVARAADDPAAILKASDQARGGGLPGIIWTITLASRDGERVEEPQTLTVKAINNSSVAETIEPARFRGSKMLQVDRNMWLTRPGLSKPIPISPRQRMSGQAANGDIAATNYAKDYEAVSAGEETIDGEACYVLNLTARHNRTTYDKIRYWVSKQRLVGVRAEFYSVSGKLIKRASFVYGNSISFNGRKVPFISRMTITDAMSSAETVMEFGHIEVKAIAPAEFDLGQLW